jgi:hypothetical protein
VHIENAQATSGDIWAEVNINQGEFYVLEDLGRTLLELRPLALPVGGSQAQSQAQARTRPAPLLGAQAETTEFVGRSAELATLQQWLDSPDPLSVMLVHGRGGQGKTRLVRHFARLASAGQDPPRLWEAMSLTGTVIDNASAMPRPAASGARGHAPPVSVVRPPADLVIVDEADVMPQSKMVELLQRPANRPGERIRVLATARTCGWWWTSLQTALGSSEITWKKPLRLGPLDSVAARQLAGAASRSFAEKLGWEQQPLSQQDLDQLALSPAASYELLVLARLYATNMGLSAPQSQRAAAELMLEPELRYWARMYSSDTTEDPYRTRLAPQFMARAVFVATLTGGFGYDIAQPIAQLAGLGCYLGPQQIIEDHARCYPAEDHQLLAPLAAVLAEEFLAMLSDLDQPAGIMPADPWAASAPFRLLGVMSPQERQPEDDIRKRCVAAGEEPPSAEPRYSKVTFGPQLQPMIIRLTRVAASWPHVAEQQLYPLAYFYPRAVITAGDAAVEELLAIDPPHYVREALDKARSEIDHDDPRPYRQAIEELAAMRVCQG